MPAAPRLTGTVTGHWVGKLSSRFSSHRCHLGRAISVAASGQRANGTQVAGQRNPARRLSVSTEGTSTTSVAGQWTLLVVPRVAARSSTGGVKSPGLNFRTGFPTGRATCTEVSVNQKHVVESLASQWTLLFVLCEAARASSTGE